MVSAYAHDDKGSYQMNRTMATARINPVLDAAIWRQMRSAAAADPGAFHGDIAKRTLHWYDPATSAWITLDGDTWRGFDAHTGRVVNPPYTADHAPWQCAFDDADAPFYRWFSGGLTNACFNEVDRHVLAGHGDEIAFHFEGDRWDPTQNDGKGGPVARETVTRKQLLLRVVLAARVLEKLGLQKGDRIVVNMPNILAQIYYTEAAKRLGVIYTPVFGGFSDKTLSDRIENAGATVILTTDGAYRNAEVVAFKETYTDAALDKYITATTARAIVAATLATWTADAALAARVMHHAEVVIAGEISLERSDVMRGIGRALEAETALPALAKSSLRTAVAKALVSTPARVQHVLVIEHTHQDVQMRRERDRRAADLEQESLAELLAVAASANLHVTSAEDILALSTEVFLQLLYAISKPLPVDAEFPLFIMYTSGSTGKPKGVVHVHGGWVSGVAYTMQVAFDAVPGVDVLYVIADPGWITGQAYMISAALTTRTTSVVAEGSPVFPNAGRFASIIERYGVTIFKAGSTFLKGVMSNPQNETDVRLYDLSSLRVGTFCAEPTSPSVQQYAMNLLTPHYINSYWATEHGGIVWTHFYGNTDFPLQADAHTYPLPWVFGEVWLADADADADDNVTHRLAADGEKGELVITRPYPYLARCIWGDAGRFGAADWAGDRERFRDTYFGKWAGVYAYTQGDFACRYADESFTLHGRSDDVINVSGHRIGTEEIEGALLRDKQITPDTPLAGVVVVGAPHRDKGLTPIAIVQTLPNRRLLEDDKRRLCDLVRQEKGALAVPSDFLEVSQFPETRSGKYMRRFLAALFEDKPLGDVSTLRNPESITEIRPIVEAWRRRTARQETQSMFEQYRYFHIAYIAVHATRPEFGEVAVVTVRNPPVNALTDRALDELNTIVGHLNRNERVQGVVFTGDGSQSFVAGADVKEFLHDMHTVEDVLPLPNKAHLAFARIEQMKKPVIAAVNGAALGGGNEFALAAHYRIAAPTARFGQPEINLHLLPGYGGTQRLPRLLLARAGDEGCALALQSILSGRAVDAQTAHALGWVDEVVAGHQNALTVAVAMLRAYIVGQGAQGGSVATVGTDLAAALAAHRQRVANAEAPCTNVALRAIGHPETERILRQARAAGREDAANRVLEAFRCGMDLGSTAGYAREAALFAVAVVSPSGGKQGIQAFLDKTSAPLPTRRPAIAADAEASLLADGLLLPWDAPFFPGLSTVPPFQYAQAVCRSHETGAPLHGHPIEAEQQLVIPVVHPQAEEVLLYMLTSEVNFNDIWAITGIPVSPFDSHDEDWHVTGSGGLGLVVETGDLVKREGRVQVGDLVTIYSGQSDLLSPYAGRDPMGANFHIQGYETPNGSHQQFLIAQAPQVHVKPVDATLEAAGSYILNLGTVYRALFTTLAIEAGKTLFVEGAATGTGLETLKTAIANGLQVSGMVSSEARAEEIRTLGATGVLNRRAPALAAAFTPVPADPAAWQAWLAEGVPLVQAYRASNNGRLADYVVSHAGETAFPRSFQLLDEGGVLTFYGASSGYHFTFMGKPGGVSTSDALQRAGLRAGERVLVYYGTALEADGIVDLRALEAIEEAREAGARVGVVTYTTAERAFVESLGFGDALRGVVSLEDIKRKYGDDFDWPVTLPPFPDARHQTEAFKAAVRHFNDVIFKPLAQAVGAWFKSADNPRGYPDIVFERAGHDALGVSTALVQPFTGRVVYAEDMGGKRYSFYAPQVWMRQRRVYMPNVSIFGTHLCNAYEVTRMNAWIDIGKMSVTAPLVTPIADLPEAHQAMWENRHASGTYVANHALPLLGLKTKEELYEAWAARGGST